MAIFRPVFRTGEGLKESLTQIKLLLYPVKLSLAKVCG